jgi:hypothetical protein
MEQTEIGVSEEAAPLSFFQRLSGIFFEPTKTFADINRKPSWIGVFVILGVLTIPFTYTMLSRVDTTTQLRQRLEAQGMPQEQIEQQMQMTNAFTQSPLYRYGIAAVSPLFTLISYLLFAAVFLLLFIIMGASLTYKKSLAVTFWGFFPPGIIAMIISTVILLAKEPGSVDPQRMLMSNLGVLVDNKAHPAIFAALSSIDLFSIWTVILLSIGFAAVSSKTLTRKKAATGIIILWAIYVLGKVGYYALIAK